ncbi:hypothetical protein [Streptomyces millisiae]|uniref:DNA-binding protein n=1 Tax=Streptomyces millisiae TaxID=3075542 RepID=A0ABU2LNZ0_9ACTN|nr:hypothetical protein [Streptomyces sp. DSM 44918]MDT0319316.1 hypothetical protein [Streptomyces sp. DSM 44918]
MIPAGRTPADSARAAQLLGIALGTFRNRKAWQKLPPTLSRPGTRQRIWDEEQLLAAVEGRPIPPLPTKPHLKDLLDLEEARLTIPEEQRPTPETWASYISDGIGPSPDEKVFGVPHFYRETIPAWLTARPGRGAGGGRPVGATDTRPRDHSNDPRHHRAQQRIAHVRRLLAADAETPAEQVASELSISKRHAERLIAQVRTEG